jgi:hypothetical protein
MLHKLQELRNKKVEIIHKIKILLQHLKQYNKDKMTDKQKSNIYKARTVKSLKPKASKLVSNKGNK